MKYLYLSILFLMSSVVIGQDKHNLFGQIVTQDSVGIEGVNIVNTTHDYGTMTSKAGEFSLPVVLGDTLFFSAIQFVNIQIIVTDSLLNKGYLKQVMEFDNITLNDVVLTPSFSMYDTNKAVGDVDMSLPFNTIPVVRPYPERRLSYLSGGIVSSIISGLNGSKKKMKKYFALEKENNLVERTKQIFDNTLYEQMGIPEEEIYLFLELHIKEAKAKGLLEEGRQFELILFLEEKSKAFIESRGISADRIFSK